jgi:hypothetical protein
LSQRHQKSGLDHHLDHRVGWVERSETQHFVFVGFRSSTQPTFHALDETMIKAKNQAGLLTIIQKQRQIKKALSFFLFDFKKSNA